MRLLAVILASAAFAADPAVDPTFLRRHLPSLPAQDLSLTCHSRLAFPVGPDARIVKGVARFAEITLDRDGACPAETLAAEEQAWLVLEGSCNLRYGGQQASLRRHDFFYVPPSVPYALSGGPCRAVVMGYKIPRSITVDPPAKLLIANLDEVKKQVVGNHPPSTLYQLLMGDTTSKRDRLAAASVLTSLFTMTITPGGTNTPHHHETEEEIYLLLDGEGDMAAGSGLDGVEGRHPSRPGDAYFFRLNCTVGFYNTGSKDALILAVRSRFPFPGLSRR
jgi:mannose-6-phosphate isomerase-like protein (cupin superfamily)